MKIEIFSTSHSAKELQHEINNWFADHSDIKPMFVNQSESCDTENGWTIVISIFYKEV